MHPTTDETPTSDARRLFPTDRAILAALAVIVVAGALLRFGSCAVPRLNVDEGWTYYLTRNPLPDVLWNLQKDRHPPLPYLLAKAMMDSGPHDELRLRLPFAGLGVLGVLAAFTLGCRLFGPAAGLGGAGLTAISYLAWEYDTWMRGYGLLTLLSLVTSLCWVQVCTGRPRTWAVGYAVSGAVLLYSHYLGVLALGTQALLALFPTREGEWLSPRDRLRRLVPCWIFMSLAFVPWLPMLKLQMTRRAARGDLSDSGSPVLAAVTAMRVLPLMTGLDSLPLLFRSWLGEGTFAARIVVWITGSGLVALAAWTGARHLRNRPMALRVVLALLLPPLLFIALIALKTPELNRIRYYAPYIPYLGMLAGVAIASRPRVFGPLAALVVLVNSLVFASYLQGPYFRSAAWQAPAAFVTAHQNRARVVVGFGNHMMYAFSYYYAGDEVSYDIRNVDRPTYPTTPRYTELGKLPLYRLWLEEVPVELEARLRGIDDVLLVLWMDGGESSSVRQWFGERFDVLDMQFVDNIEEDGRVQTLLLHRHPPSPDGPPAGGAASP